MSRNARLETNLHVLNDEARLMKIMAPAGDSERLDAAIKAGADEVYMGVSGFGARRFARNFSVDEYCAALDRAHRVGVSVHLTFNTILSDAELDEFYPSLKQLYETGLDAVIVQDFGAVLWLKERFPDLKLCASTQLSPASGVEADWYERQGFDRVVLARELSLDEIRAIRNKTKIELEVFVSGALCLGCSGKCYLSSFIGGRSGNRGMCAQPCRQYYRAEKLEGNNAPSGGDYGYFLSLRDQLQGSAEIKALFDAGVDSLKIEGRMKSPSYVYQTTRYYRDLVDSVMGVSPKTSAKRLAMKASTLSAPERRAGVRANESARQTVVGEGTEEARRNDVAALFNRGYAHGYFYEHDPAIVNEFYSSNFGVEVGRVRRDAVRLSQPIRNGDGVVFLDDAAGKLGGLHVSGIRLLDPTNSRRSKIVEAASYGDLVQFHEPVPENAKFLYRTFNYQLNKEIDNALQQTRRREPVDARLVARVGRPLELSLKSARACVTVRAEQGVAPAQKKGVDAESLTTSLDRFGETPFYLDQTRLDFDANAFVPKSLLNMLRQEAVDKLVDATLKSYRRVAPTTSESATNPARSGVHIVSNSEDALSYVAVSVRTRPQYDACRALGVRKIYYETRPVQYESRFRFLDSELFAPIAGSLAEALRLERLGKPYALGWFFNVANSRAVRYLAQRLPHADVMYLSPEISDHAVDAIFDRLRETPGIALGLPVYGRLLAMYTQKTLFDNPRTLITNADDRRMIVERNAGRQTGFSDLFTAAFAPTDAADARVAEPTGSSIYLCEPLDLLDAIPQIVGSGISEVLLTFTDEEPSDVRRLIERACKAPTSDKRHTFSYGYTRTSVF